MTNRHIYMVSSLDTSESNRLNMWKTVSARIRGATAELEEMGEETDGVAESSSKLRNLILGMTGFDIMENESTYKDMMSIIIGIGEAWDTLSDVDQAALLEKLAGKVQSNALAAALDNYEMIQEAYNTAENSDGSALRENEKYLESIQGHLDQLTNKWQELWASELNRDTINFFLDLGKAILEVVDAIGVFNTALIGIGAYFYVDKHKETIFSLLDSIPSIINGTKTGSDVIKNILGKKIMPGTVTLTDSLLGQLNVLKDKSFTKDLDIGNKLNELLDGEIDDNLLEYAKEVQEAAKEGEEFILTQEGLVASMQRSQGPVQKNVTVFGNLINAFKAGGAAFSESGGSVKSFGSALWSTLTPLNQVLLVLGAIGAVIGIFDALTTTVEEHEKKLSSLKSDCYNITSEIESLNSELSTTRAKIRELELKGKLSFTEQEELNNLKAQNNELQRSIDLLEDEQKAKSDAINKEFVATMDKDLGVKQFDYSKGYISEEENIENQFDDLKKWQEKKAEVEEKILGTSDEKEKDRYKRQADSYQQQIESIEQYLNDTEKSLSDRADGIDYIKNPNSDDEKAVNAWLDYIYNFQDKMAIAMDGTNAKTNAFNRLIDNWQFDTALQNLQDLGEQGKVTTEDITKALADPDETLETFITNLVELGVIDSADNLNAIADAFNNLADSAENANSKINSTGNSIADSRLDMISNINSMSEGFEELDKIFASIKDDDSFDFKLLDDDNFKNTFGELDTYADFIETITSNSNDISKCRDAFNDLVSEWIESTGVLNGVTEENAALTTSMLEQMGVVNANTLVQQKLTENKWKAKAASLDLTNATDIEISALIAEAEASGITKAAIYDLISAETILNSTKLNFKQQINALYDLAMSLGVTAAAANSTAVALRNEQRIAAKEGWTPSEDQIKNFIKTDLLNQIKAQFGNIGDVSVKVDYSGGSASNKGSSSGSGSSAQETKESFDWIERAVQKVQRTIENLSKTVSATYKKWSTRNSALKDQISAINSEISIQQKAYDYYMKKANAIGLSSTYINRIKDGTINIETITNESLIDKINEYQDLYDKAISAKDAITDLKDEIAALAKEKFDNVTAELDNKLVFLDHEMEMINSSIDLVESKGYVIGKSYYEELNKKENERLKLLEQQRNILKKEFEDAVKTGQIEQYSEDWYDMASAILEVDKTIADANQSVIDIQKSLRDLDWEAFDKMQELFSGVQEENDFYIDLMSNDKMVDENGNFTDEGLATMGLHTVNYNAYMAQANKYAKEIKDINKELAKDPNNQELLERRNELLESQRDMILSAEDEKQAVKSLYEDSYNSLLDALDKLINKRKELLQSTKDLYDYEKNISEQTKEIARLEKIMASFSGMDTEESKAAIQKYKVELEEAKENLEETEYDKYVQDQEQMLDELQTYTEEWVNQRLDNIDALLSSAIESTNQNSDAIRETLTVEAENVGIKFSENMNSIWGADGSFTTIVSQYSNNFSSQLTTVNTTLGNIEKYVSQLRVDADKEADKTTGEIDKTTEVIEGIKPPPVSSSSSSSSGSSSTGSSSSSSSNSSSVSKPQVSAIKEYLKYGSRGTNVKTLQKALNMIQNSGLSVDGIFGTKTQAAVKKFQKNNSLSQDGIVGPKTKAKFKAKGYAKGSKKIMEEQLAITNEAGQEIIYRAEDNSILTPLRPGDKVFENEAVQRLWDISHNPDFTRMMLGNASLPSVGTGVIGKPMLQNISNVLSNDMNGDMVFNIEMNGINDPQKFAVQLKHELLYNKDVNKIVQNSALGAAMGKNSLNKFNYR